MKKIFTLVIAAVAVLSANAQYFPTEKGTVLKYAGKMEADSKTQDNEKTITVLDVTTGADGIVTARLEEETPIPDSPVGATMKEVSVSTFNPADTTTTIIVAGAEDSKTSIIEMVKTQAASAGQALSDSQLEELNKEIKVTGELSFELNPNFTTDNKQKNKTMRLRMGPMNFTYNLWEFKVLGKENVTTPAGSFDCLKVSYVHKIKMGDGVMKFDTTEWYAEGIGLVRSTSTDKKNGINQESELVSVQKP